MIKDEAENEKITAVLLMVNATATLVAGKLYDNGSVVWLDGEVAGYVNWAQNEIEDSLVQPTEVTRIIWKKNDLIKL